MEVLWSTGEYKEVQWSYRGVQRTTVEVYWSTGGVQWKYRRVQEITGEHRGVQ